MSKPGERLIRAAKETNATARGDAPLPSELVEKWTSEARAFFDDPLHQNARLCSREEARLESEAWVKMNERWQCARELQASLDAMQKEGGE